MKDRVIAWCAGLSLAVVAFVIAFALSRAGIWIPPYGADFGLPIVVGWATGRMVLEYRRQQSLV